MQKKATMDKREEDWNGLQLWFLNIHNSFLKVGFVVCNVWNIALEVYLF